MKKIYVLLLILSFALPVSAVCSITGGACSPMNFEPSNLNERVVPNNLKNMQRTDAFQPKIQEPAGSINVLPNNNVLRQKPEASSFDDNCVSGNCLQED